MLNLGYCFGIRSECRICEAVHFNLACRRFCRLDLDDLEQASRPVREYLAAREEVNDPKEPARAAHGNLDGSALDELFDRSGSRHQPRC